jgi:nucleotide-binding universal stress UspA family protein
VADKAASSVLVVRESGSEIGRILIPIGSQKLNRKLLETGANLARAAGATVTALHVTAPVPAMYTGLEGMEETLEEMLQTDTPIAQHLHWCAQYLAEMGVESEIEIRHGTVTDEVLRETLNGEYDLVVLGATEMEGPLKRMMAEKISPQVIEKAPCSVLIVKDTPVGS